MDDNNQIALLGAAVAVSVMALILRRRKERRWNVRPANRGPYSQKGQFARFLRIKNEDPEEFFNLTRMDKTAFDRLLALVTEKLKFRRRNSIPPEMKLAVTLQYFAQGTSFHKESLIFRIGLSTITQIVDEVAATIIAVLMPICLRPPTEANWLVIANGVEKRWNLPNCIGALDGKNIQIQAPVKSGSPHLNRKKTFSLVVIAVVDHNYRFVVADIGAFDSESNGGVFAQTRLGQSVLDETLSARMSVPKERKIPGFEYEMPFYLVGDAAFPLKRNLMKTFSGKNLLEKEETFNDRLTRVSRLADNGFGILFSRWRLFGSTITAGPDKVEKFALACICLHNFIMQYEDNNVKRYNPPGYTDSESADGTVILGTYRDELPCGNTFLPSPMLGSRNSKRTAYDMRQELAAYFMGQAKCPGRLAA